MVSVSALALASLAIGAVPATAATITVNNTSDSGAGSLRAALGAASSGDTINITVTGTITLSSTISISSKTLTINGPTSSASDLVINGAGRKVFSLGSSADVTLTHLTLTTTTPVGDWNGGCVAASSSVFRTDDVTFTACRTNTNQYHYGGAIFLSHSSANIAHSSFLANDARAGAAIYADWGDPADFLTISDSAFTSNATGPNSPAKGGAIASAIDTTITRSTFTTNSSHQNGGAVAFWSPSWDRKQFSISGSTFTQNHAGTQGGAVSVSWMIDGAITDSTFTSNEARDGGAIAYDCYGDNGNPSGPYQAPNCQESVSRSTFNANTSTTDGGAIFAGDTATNGPSSGTLAISASQFADNVAGGRGGGIFSEETANQVTHFTVEVSTSTGTRNSPQNSVPDGLLPEPLPDPAPSNSDTSDTQSGDPSTEPLVEPSTSSPVQSPLVSTMPAKQTLKLQLPTRIARFKKVILIPHWLTTSAGERVRPRIAFVEPRSKAVGEVQGNSWRIGKRGKVVVRVMSPDSVDVVLKLHAPGSATFKPYHFTKVYHLK